MIDAMRKALGQVEVKPDDPKPAEVKATDESAKATSKPKEEAKTTEKPRVSDFDAAKQQSDKAAGDEPKPGTKEFNFKALEAKATSAASEAAKLRAELAAAKALLENNEWKTKAELVSKEKEDLSKRLMEASLERHPKFQAHYNGQFSAIGDTIKRIMPGEVGEKLAKAAANGTIEDMINDPTMEEAMASLPVSKSTIVGSALNKAIELHKERQAALANPATHLEDASKVETARRQEWMNQANSTFESVKQKAMDFLPVFQRREGDNEWNTAVETDLKNANEVFTSISTGQIGVDELSKVVLWGQAAPKLLETVQVQTSMIAKLNEQIQKLEGAQPGVGSKSATTTTSSAPKTFMEAVTENLRR